ncbi:MAG TPA: FtsX-like permease family protein [Rhodanobacteraceae bacterium]|nr:FtsX-like permease family protein [Rhodanobacteraceae bacterium]
MQIQPILAALRKHRLATLLIALEVALACAVLCNACSMIADRLSAMRIDSGVDENSLGIVSVTGFDANESTDLNARMLAGLGAIPGVQSVHVISSVPFGTQNGVSGIRLEQTPKRAAVAVVQFYEGDPGTIKALGLQVVAGHVPDADDYQPLQGYAPPDSRVLIARALADKLWPDENPLGKEFWSGKFHFRVIGVLAHLAVSQYNETGRNGAEWTVFVPAQPGGLLSGSYLLRADPGNLTRVMRDAKLAVAKIAPDAVLDLDNSHTLGELRNRFFRNDRAMAGLMVGVIAALLLVTSLGIVGLASFWVAQRHKQIGIRRALGARRVDILHYFQTENFLIVTFGIVPGIVMALAINLTLMKFYELPRLPLLYLPVGAVALWALGQLAVLHPALRAAAVPPVVATRTV